MKLMSQQSGTASSAKMLISSKPACSADRINSSLRSTRCHLSLNRFFMGVLPCLSTHRFSIFEDGGNELEITA
jgi:hypothetical protein